MVVMRVVDLWIRLQAFFLTLGAPWVTAIAATGAFLAASYYACQAQRQTSIAAENLERSTRPIIAVATYHPNIKLGQAGDFAEVELNNFGKTPTKALKPRLKR